MLLLMVRRTGGDPAWGGSHDPGIAPAGHVGLGHCPPERPRPQDRAQVHLPRPGGAGLWSAQTPSDRPRSLHRLLARDRKSTRLNSSHANISYAVFCLKKKSEIHHTDDLALRIDYEQT